MKKFTTAMIVLVSTLLFSGTPMDIYYEVVDNTYAWYDFSAEPYDGITANAYITVRPAEIQYAPGNMMHVDMGGISIIYCNPGNFTTNWATGNVVRITVIDLSVNRCGQVDITLDGSGAPIFGGPSLGGVAPYDDAIQVINFPYSISENIPTEIKLHQNYPNPFNPTTTIKFDLASNSNVKLNVYNYNGQFVESLVNGTMNAGFYSVNFDASSLSAGVYYYTMEAAGKSMTQKMILVK